MKYFSFRNTQVQKELKDMPNSTASSIGPPRMLDCIFDSLDILRERNDAIQEILRGEITKHNELKKKVDRLEGENAVLKSNDHIQDGRLTSLEANMRMVCAEIKVRPGVPGSSAPPGPLSPGALNISSTGSTTKTQKDPVPCPVCGKVLAKSSLKRHMTNPKACPNRS